MLCKHRLCSQRDGDSRGAAVLSKTTFVVLVDFSLQASRHPPDPASQSAKNRGAGQRISLLRGQPVAPPRAGRVQQLPSLSNMPRTSENREPQIQRQHAGILLQHRLILGKPQMRRQGRPRNLCAWCLHHPITPGAGGTHSSAAVPRWKPRS